MFIKLNRKKTGFILYESILMLMVTIMTLGILQQSLQLLNSIQKTSFREQLHWHITQEKLQDMMANSKIYYFDKNRVIFGQKDSPSRQVIEWESSNILRIRKAGKEAYEPIMMNLKKIEIEKIRNLVIITTENNDNQTSKMCLLSDD